MSVSGCVAKCSARLVSSSPIYRLSSAMIPTVARAVAPNAAVTSAGAASCSETICGLDLSGSGIDIALAPGTFGCRSDLRQAPMRTFDGSGSAVQYRQGIPVCQVIEHLQCRGQHSHSDECNALVCRVRAQIRF